LAHNLALTNGSGTAFFFAASTVGEYLNLSELWYSLNVSFQQVFFSLFSALFLWTQCIYACMEAKFCLRVKNKIGNYQE